MDKRNFIINFLICVLILIIAIIFVFKYVIKKDNINDNFKIKNINKIKLKSLNNVDKKFVELTGTDDIYVFFFIIKSCPSCINKGFNELKILNKRKKRCIAVIIHDWVEEIKAWSVNCDFSPIYIMKRKTFYEHIQAPFLPVLVKFKGRKIQNYHYITP